MRSILQPHIEFRFETPDILARAVPNKPFDWQRSMGNLEQWLDDTQPRTATPVRFGVNHASGMYDYPRAFTFTYRD